MDTTFLRYRNRRRGEWICKARVTAHPGALVEPDEWAEKYLGCWTRTAPARSVRGKRQPRENMPAGCYRPATNRNRCFISISPNQTYIFYLSREIVNFSRFLIRSMNVGTCSRIPLWLRAARHLWPKWGRLGFRAFDWLTEIRNAPDWLTILVTLWSVTNRRRCFVPPVIDNWETSANWITVHQSL